jgi:hypothetical protein
MAVRSRRKKIGFMIAIMVNYGLLTRKILVIMNPLQGLCWFLLLYSCYNNDGSTSHAGHLEQHIKDSKEKKSAILITVLAEELENVML